MRRRLYEVIDGTPRLCDGVDYWKEMFNLQVEDGLHFNPFSHHISCVFDFTWDDNTYRTEIRTSNGLNNTIVSRGDELIMEITADNFYDYHKFQISYWNYFSIPLVQQLLDIGIITDEDMRKYCSVFFFPPIVGDRPADPYLLKVKEIVAQHKILGTLKDMIKPEYKYEDIDLYDYLVQQNIIEPIK